MKALWPAARHVSGILLAAGVSLAGGGSLSPQAGPVNVTQMPGERKGSSFQVERRELPVPENRQRPGARLIRLPLERITKPGASQGLPVFFFGGGPGASNLVDDMPLWAEGILANHPIVLLGYRGADGSVVLRCPEIAQAERESTGDLLGPVTRSRVHQAMVRSVARLRAEGVDLEGYSVAEVLEDIEAAREALGYERIHLMGFSYGTRLALLYAQRHPERVGRSLLVGANPPGRFFFDPHLTDQVIQEYARLWAQDKARSAACPDLPGAIRRVSQTMPKHWMGIPIDPGRVRTTAFALLYSRKSAPMALDAFAAADRGDASGLAALSLAGTAMLRNQGEEPMGDLYCKGVLDYEPGRNYAAEARPPDAILGAPFSELIWGPLTEGCPWPPAQASDDLRRLQPSEVETLVLSGSLDVATPAQIATREVLPFLRRGQQIILPGKSHVDLFREQPEAFETLAVRFLDTGKADASGFAHAPQGLGNRLWLPTLAKLAAAGLLLGVLALGAAAWWAAKRLRRILIRRRSGQS
ncbi:MAG: alpha/beta fold hydrolase [Acidobacteria bacterium]|nr:alpha/beta fold hydrolase [Acidobacteriota bacterium]MBI3490164.1 alpha/beta fold hydrolase [Acidobacteriota bacterium]